MVLTMFWITLYKNLTADWLEILWEGLLSWKDKSNRFLERSDQRSRSRSQKGQTFLFSR